MLESPVVPKVQNPNRRPIEATGPGRALLSGKGPEPAGMGGSWEVPSQRLKT